MNKTNMKKKTHGGKRKGAGRKKKEETKVIRVPKSKLESVQKLIAGKTFIEQE